MQEHKGFYGEYGGQFIPETLIPALDELEAAYASAKKDEQFQKDFDYYLKKYAGRSTPVYYASNFSQKYGVEVYLKREDLLHTGAHKINNTLGQALLTRFMNKKRVIAETGAGQHGVATATVAALFGLECVVYMGKLDAQRQLPNVKRMQLLGATVIEVDEGSRTLKDAMNAALRDWVKNVETTHYLIGTAAGPYPFPEMVAQFQSVIGIEAREQIIEESGSLPDVVVAPIGGGSNAIGIFRGFMNDKKVKLVGVEAGGVSDEAGKHARSIGKGKQGILHGAMSYLVQDENYQVADVHSISAGLDYPGVGPEHAHLFDIGRAVYEPVLDDEAVNAFKELCRLEGIIPALESSHALAYVIKHVGELKGKKILVNLSGRGDKDLGILEQEGVI